MGRLAQRRGRGGEQEEQWLMAIVKANYIKRGMGERARAKATIRYIQHRRGKEGERITRALFGSDGLMGRYEAYRMIDEAEKGSLFFRFVISPDEKTEDTKRDLSLREVTAQTMLSLEERVHTPVSWVATVHADHAPHRHVHIVAVLQERLQVQDFQALRQTATEACLERRKELDLAREQKEREREEAAWERSV
jgi:hypothetical protein